MLMKKIDLSRSRLIQLLLIVVLCSPGSALAKNPSLSRTSPEDTVRQFYAWFLKAGFPLPKRSNLPTFRKYISQRFLKKAMDPEVDSVLFIDAQDDDSTWANNFTVAPATVQGQTATTEVTLTGKTVHYKLVVTLRRENGVWKIDGVKGKDWKDVTSG
jgi:hypothetical protein